MSRDSDAGALQTAIDRGATDSFPQLAAWYLEEYLAKIRIGVARLGEEDLWWRPAAGANSVGNLLLHLRGNLSLWILQGLGGRPYARDRAGEFTADGGHDADSLVAGLAETIASCRQVLADLGPEELAHERSIQGYDANGLTALFHAVEHMSYHTGQILWVVKERTLDADREDAFELYPQHADE